MSYLFKIVIGTKRAPAIRWAQRAFFRNLFSGSPEPYGRRFGICGLLRQPFLNQPRIPN